jgi:hypothetical protein
MLNEMGGAGAAQGLSWSWELDFAALLECLTGPGPHDPPGSRLGAAPSGAGRSSGIAGAGSAGPARSGAPGRGAPHDAGPGCGEGARGAVPADPGDPAVPVPGDPGDLGVPGDRVPAGALAGRLAGRLAPGPDLAAWLSLVPAGELGDADLAATAGGWRRLASWAASRELAAVAQIASRAAARDQDIGTGEDGRPARVPASAAAEVALELAMSRYGAAGWADLAVELGWRLAAAGAALESGDIDVYRARLIAEATGPLSDEAARAVQDKVLPAAGRQTPGMLRAALRRAVLTADPEGAEQRRKESERQAKVVLYPDEDHTATLAGQRLPVLHAAAAMARIKAMARAWKASGAAGGIDLLSAKIYLGLLLGTLPLIPPPEGAPPGNPPGNPGDDPRDPGGSPGSDGGHGDRGDGPGARAGAGQDPRSARPPGSEPPGRNRPPSAGTPGDDSSRRIPSGGSPPDGSPDANAPDGNGPGDDPPRRSPPDRSPEGNGLPGGGMPRDEVPPPGDQDAPRDEEDYPCAHDSPAGNDRDDDNGGEGGWQEYGPPPGWPALPVIPPPPARPATGDAGPVPGLLDVTLPWPVLAGASQAGCEAAQKSGRIVETAHELGINEDLQPVLPISIGADETTLLELTGAYQVFANAGQQSPPYAVEAVVDAKGHQIFQHEEVDNAVINPAVAYLITGALKAVIRYGTGASSGRLGLDFPAAGKTGTTQDFHDAYFIGYTPEIVCGVWVGFDTPQNLGSTGAQAALPAWVQFMKDAAPADPQDFPEPSGITMEARKNGHILPLHWFMIFSIVAPAGVVAIRPAKRLQAQKSAKARRISSPQNINAASPSSHAPPRQDPVRWEAPLDTR